jgi:hypothetical protein
VHGFCHRDAVMAIAHEVVTANPDDFDRRQPDVLEPRSGDSQPAFPGMGAQGTKISVEIAASPQSGVIVPSPALRRSSTRHDCRADSRGPQVIQTCCPR